MAKEMKKKEESKEAVAQEVNYNELPAELRKKFEEEALERVSRAVGITSEEVKAAPAKAEMYRYDLGPIVVKINGHPYTGKGIAKKEVVETIVYHANELKQRYLREMTDNGNQKRTQDVHAQISMGPVAE